MSSDEGREKAWEDQTIWIDCQVGEGANVYRLHSQCVLPAVTMKEYTERGPWR